MLTSRLLRLSWRSRYGTISGQIARGRTLQGRILSACDRRNTLFARERWRRGLNQDGVTRHDRDTGRTIDSVVRVACDALCRRDHSGGTVCGLHDDLLLRRGLGRRRNLGRRPNRIAHGGSSTDRATRHYRTNRHCGRNLDGRACSKRRGHRCRSRTTTNHGSGCRRRRKTRNRLTNARGNRIERQRPVDSQFLGCSKTPGSSATRTTGQEVRAHLGCHCALHERIARLGAGAGIGDIGQADQRLARPIDQRVDALRCGLQHRSRLDCRKPKPLTQHECFALLRRQRAKQCNGHVELITTLARLGDRCTRIGMPLLERLVRPATLRHRDARQALIPQNPKQPSARLADLLAFRQHTVRRQERRLDRVLSILEPTKAVPCEAQQFGAVRAVESSGTSALFRARRPPDGDGDCHAITVDAFLARI